MEVPQEIKNRNITQSSNLAIPLLDKDPKELKEGSQRDIYTLMFITAVISARAKTWKRLTCPQERNRQKQNVEYYSALKRKGILTDATACMNLEDIMLSEIN